MLVAGPLADHHGHRPVLVAMHALRVLSQLAAAAATEPPQLLAVAVLFGLSSFRPGRAGSWPRRASR